MRSCTLSAVFLGALAFGPACAAAPQTPEEIQRLERQIEAERKGQAANAAEISSLRAEIARLGMETSSLAQALVEAEADAAAIEERIREQMAREAIESAALAERRAAMSPLLAALQRLRRDPPPAFAVTPGDGADAARAAMLLSEITSGLRARAEEVAATLNSLQAVRAGLERNRDEAAARARDIEARRAEIDAVIERRQTAIAALNAASAEAGARIGALEARNDDLQALIAWAADPGAQSGGGGAAARPERFAARKGKLAWPAAGRLIAAFGANLPLGGKAEGMSLETASGVRVIAPCDGEIVFADTFRAYGRLLILSAGDGYFVLLAGLGRLDALPGQRVLSGEPLGVMGDAASGVPAPRLYIEIQKDGRALDPAVWFASGPASG